MVEHVFAVEPDDEVRDLRFRRVNIAENLPSRLDHVEVLGKIREVPGTGVRHLEPGQIPFDTMILNGRDSVDAGECFEGVLLAFLSRRHRIHLDNRGLGAVLHDAVDLVGPGRQLADPPVRVETLYQSPCVHNVGNPSSLGKRATIPGYRITLPPQASEKVTCQ